MKMFAKVLAVVMALALLLSLAACGSNDSKEEKKDDAPSAVEPATEAPAPTIVGTWESNEAPGSYIVFNADGNGSMVSDGYSIGFSYTDDGASIVMMNGNDNTQQVTYKYTLDGDALSLTDEESSTTLTYKRVDAIPTVAPDPDATENNSALVGSWECEQNGIQVTYTFNADGTGTVEGGATSMSFVYTDDGSSVDLGIGGSFDEESSPAPYTIEGDTLTITPEDGEAVTMTKKQ